MLSVHQYLSTESQYMHNLSAGGPQYMETSVQGVRICSNLVGYIFLV